MQRAATGAESEARAVWCYAVSQANALLCGRGVELGRWSQGEVSRGKLWSKKCGAQSRRVDEEVLCIEFGVWSVAWWFVCRSCAPDDAGVADPPGLAVFDTTHTLTPPAVGGLLLGGRAKCWHLVRIAAQHSTAQHNPGLACWWRSALIGQGPCGWRTGRRRRMCLSCRRDWRAAGGNQRSGSRPGLRADSSSEFESRGNVERGFEGGGQVVSSDWGRRRGKTRRWW